MHMASRSAADVLILGLSLQISKAFALPNGMAHAENVAQLIKRKYRDVAALGFEPPRGG